VKSESEEVKVACSHFCAKHIALHKSETFDTFFTGSKKRSCSRPGGMPVHLGLSFLVTTFIIVTNSMEEVNIHLLSMFEI
jgi:hypothetical protein